MYDFSDFKEQEEKAKISNEQQKAEVKETREITNTITNEEKTPSHESSKGGVSEDAISSSFTDQKLDKIYDVLNHIRWIGLGIGGMFALTFIVPQMCTGG